MNIKTSFPFIAESRKLIQDTLEPTSVPSFSLSLLLQTAKVRKLLSDAIVDCSMFVLFNHLGKFSSNPTEGMEKLKAFIKELPKYIQSDSDETIASMFFRVHNILLKSVVFRYEVEGEKCESVLVKFTEEKKE